MGQTRHCGGSGTEKRLQYLACLMSEVGGTEVGVTEVSVKGRWHLQCLACLMSEVGVTEVGVRGRWHLQAAKTATCCSFGVRPHSAGPTRGASCPLVQNSAVVRFPAYWHTTEFPAASARPGPRWRCPRQPHAEVRQTRDALSVPELRRWKSPARLGFGARTLQQLQLQIRAQRRRRFDSRHVLQFSDRRVSVCLVLQRWSW